MTRFPPRHNKTSWGYDLGQTLSRHMQVPFALRDRDDGTVWYFTASTTTDPTLGQKERLAWNTTPPGGGITSPIIHPAFSEPVLGDTQLRIFVRGGRLGFEAADTHIYIGPRWMPPHSVTPLSVRYELKVPTGGLPTPPRLAFETQPDW